jgi:hypothetical protein
VKVLKIPLHPGDKRTVNQIKADIEKTFNLVGMYSKRVIIKPSK